MTKYFCLLRKWERLNSGDCFLHDFKHEGLAQCASSALVTNQIAHYINGPIESAVAHLGVVPKAYLGLKAH